MSEVTILNRDKVLVQFKFDWLNRIKLSSSEDVDIKVLFKNMSWEDHRMLESVILLRFEGKHERDVTVVTDMIAFNSEIMRRFLKSWNVAVPLEFDEFTGFLTDKCFDRVMSLPGPFIRTLVEKFEQSLDSKDDEYQLLRQCAALFSPKSGGVANPTESVSLFCTLGNFWEKFGLNRETLEGLSYKEYTQLKYMLSKEGEARDGKMHSSSGSRRPTMVAMGGTKPRPSRGKIVRED